MNQIFRTSIKDLVSRNKFFQCFVCYEEFDSEEKYPMEVCRNHHYMCNQCVKSRAFKNKAKNHYLCGLCSVKIKITEIKKNPFILSIKEFFESLIERQESSRNRYTEYMENQEKIVQILLEENQNILKESEEHKKEVEQLREEIKIFKAREDKKKLTEKQKTRVEGVRKQEVQAFYVSDDQDAQFEKFSGQKGNDKQPVGANSIFRSNLFGSGIKMGKQEKKQEFVPNPAFSQIYLKGSSSVINEKPQSKLVKLMNETKKLKEEMIHKENESKIKLKQSLQELKVHKKYIDYSAEEDNHDNEGQILEQKSHPQKKVHLNEESSVKVNQVPSKPDTFKSRNPWFPFL